MAKVMVEFINTCPTCDGHTRDVQEIAARYGDKVESKVYYAGKDFDYIPKYGVLLKGTLIINGKKKIQTITKDIMEREIDLAVRELES